MRAFRYLTTFFVLAAPVLAQQPPASQQPPESVFGEQIEVRVVNVEVVVTDKQGNRVAGLAPGDFRLRVDGKEVPIEYFTEVRGGQAIASEAAGAEGPVPGLPSLAPGSPVGTSYLVFIDDYFSIPTRRNEVLRSLKAEIARLGPEDRMAIVAFDGRRPEMLSTWSNSERTLTRALDEAMLREAYGFQRLAELRSFETTRRLGGSASTARSRFSQQLDIEEISYAERVASQIGRVVSAAVGTLRGFASPPGRKVMLLLSGGWPYSPVEFVINDPTRPVVSRDVPGGEELLRPLTDTANRLGYTVYPVDVPGVEIAGPDASLASPSRAGGLNLREQEMHATLQSIAEETGGRALLNAGREQALPVAESDTRSYYWLGFTPGWQKNDQRHDVEVEVRRPGLQVRSRDSFLDLSRKTEVSMMVESAMLFGAGPGSTPMPMQLGEPVKAGRREIEVPVTLAIPADAVTMGPIEGKHVAQLELRIAAVDVEGNRSAIPVVPLQLSLDQPPPKGAHLRYDTKIKLRRIKQHLIVAVFDPLSNRILTAEADVTP